MIDPNIDESLTKVNEIRRMVKGLMYSFPEVNYVAVNPTLSDENAGEWLNSWYLVGFKTPPILKEVMGYYLWVTDDDVDFDYEEHAEFFVHFNSDKCWLDDKLLQISKSEWLDQTELCFTMDENGNIINYENANNIHISLSDGTNELDKVLD